MVSMTSNKTSLEAAAVDAGTTKRAEAGRTVIDGTPARRRWHTDPRHASQDGARRWEAPDARDVIARVAAS